MRVKAACLLGWGGGLCEGRRTLARLGLENHRQEVVHTVTKQKTSVRHTETRPAHANPI